MAATGIISGTSDDNDVTVKVFSDSVFEVEVPGSGSVTTGVLTWTASSNVLLPGVYYVVVTDTVGNETVITIMAS